MDSVSQLVINMLHYPVEDYIFGDFIMTGMSQENTKKLLSDINIDNMRIVHVSQNNTFDKIGFWDGLSSLI